MSLIAKICVSIICHREDGKILMVEESRDGNLTINLPTGAVEENENFEMAASRELLEETGLYPMDMCYLGNTVLKKHPATKEADASKDPAYLTFVYSVSADMCQSNKLIWPYSTAIYAKINDVDVVAAKWMSVPEIYAARHLWRNNLIIPKIEMLIHNKKIKHFKNINLYHEATF